MQDNRPDPPKFDEVNPDHLAEVGGPIDRATVSLRIFGDDLEPEVITQLVGCEPTRALRKGEVIAEGGYRRVAPTGSWLLSGTEPADEDLETQVLALLGRTTSDEQVWVGLAEHFTIDVFCGVFLDDWNRGFSLSPFAMSELAQRHLVVNFDIYAPVSDS